MLNDQLTLEIVVQKDMLALEDLRKLSPSDQQFRNFFWRRSQGFGRRRAR
jgi:hypothetical protein